jgi:hypothetical protein
MPMTMVTVMPVIRMVSALMLISPRWRSLG